MSLTLSFQIEALGHSFSTSDSRATRSVLTLTVRRPTPERHRWLSFHDALSILSERVAIAR